MQRRLISCSHCIYDSNVKRRWNTVILHNEEKGILITGPNGLTSQKACLPVLQSRYLEYDYLSRNYIIGPMRRARPLSRYGITSRAWFSRYRGAGMTWFKQLTQGWGWNYWCHEKGFWSHAL
jgi:hypothetical protein